MDLKDIQNKIDQIWDAFWNGGITNSITIAEQLTYLLFMKMLDDAQTLKEQNAKLFGDEVVNPIFPVGNWTNPDNGESVDFQMLRWNNFMHISGSLTVNNKDIDIAKYLKDYVFVFIKTLNGKDSAYSKFMQNASFLIDNSRTLQRVLALIDELNLTDKDIMGDFYEYILNKMAASGNNGQFRTPRQIINMMVQIMRPTIKDSICDPAMGSAGFIVGCAKYIQDNCKDDLKNNENFLHYKTAMFSGFDTDATMLRIGTMNLMLHDVDSPNVDSKDSISKDNTLADEFSLIMANPPFTGSVDKDSISPSLTKITNTKKTELLFVALFVRMLKTGGRCASIVPDGVLFGNSTGHKSLRKEIVDNQRLMAVISMPSGIFQPYSGVSTAILVFQKTGNGGTDKVWFYDMKSDGRSLDQKRTVTDPNGGDIPDIISRFHNMEAEAGRTRKDQSFLVPVDEIRANDYDLSINKYKEVERVKVQYEDPSVVFARIKDLHLSISQSIKDYEEKYL